MAKPGLGFLTMVLGAIALPLQAADHNDALQLRAKAALEEHARLKTLNLWVSARDGVVLVTGGVPSQDAVKDIEAALAKVTGVAIVRVNTWVVPAVDPLKQAFAIALEGPKAPITSGVQPVLAMNPVLPGTVTVPVPPLPEGIGTELDDRTRGVVVAQKFEPLWMGGMLLAPVETYSGVVKVPEGLNLPPAPAVLPYPTIPAPRVPVAPVERELTPLEQAMELLKLRQSKAEYEPLSVELRDGVAEIRGRVAPAIRAEFAEALRKIPGVNLVK